MYAEYVGVAEFWVATIHEAQEELEDNPNLILRIILNHSNPILIHPSDSVTYDGEWMIHIKNKNDESWYLNIMDVSRVEKVLMENTTWI